MGKIHRHQKSMILKKEITIGKIYQFKNKTMPICISIWRKPYRHRSAVTNIRGYKYLNPEDVFLILECHPIHPRTDFAIKILSATGIIGWLCIDPEDIMQLC
jgi:hypothetical protein